MLFAAGEIPFATTVVGVITAIATLTIAVGGVITALTVFLPMYRQTKEIHTIVNQQRTDMERYQRALVAALKQAGVSVPADQSITDPAEPA
jgi:UPF0716 family protein affecting phage T7 exclusion